MVTGANRGTGKSVADALKERGMHVLALGRTPVGDPGMQDVYCDMNDQESVRSAIDSVLSLDSPIDVCVLSAAHRALRKVCDMSMEDWWASAMTNLVAPGMIISGLLPRIREARGTVVIIGSHAATHFFEGGAGYSSSKAGLKPLTEVLLLEERMHGVRTMLVSPGAISNRPWDDSLFKMKPESVAKFVTQAVYEMPPDIAAGEIEIRPARLAPAAVSGIERIQHI